MIKGNLRQPEGCMQEKPQYNHETRTQSAIFSQTVTVYQQKPVDKLFNSLKNDWK